MKVGPNGSIDRFKACLVAKRGIFRSLASTIRIPFPPWLRLILFICFFLWLLFVLATSPIAYQSVFLHGELQNEVYMDQPLSFTASGGSHLVCPFQ